MNFNEHIYHKRYWILVMETIRRLEFTAHPQHTLVALFLSIHHELKATGSVLKRIKMHLLCQEWREGKAVQLNIAFCAVCFGSICATETYLELRRCDKDSNNICMPIKTTLYALVECVNKIILTNMYSAKDMYCIFIQIFLYALNSQLCFMFSPT